MECCAAAMSAGDRPELVAYWSFGLVISDNAKAMRCGQHRERGAVQLPAGTAGREAQLTNTRLRLSRERRARERDAQGG
jgi:hypothetical protein